VTPLSKAELGDELKRFLLEELSSPVMRDDPLFSSGILASADLPLVAERLAELGYAVDPRDVTPGQFDTINKIVELAWRERP